jgi:uncharacterized protein YraI
MLHLPRSAFLIIICAGIILLGVLAPADMAVSAQQPTGSIPTVTGTPEGAVVAVYSDLSQVKVYSGPSIYEYPPIGVLLAGQQSPAFAISEDGNWIQIYYPGVAESVAWVYAPYVTFKKSGELPVLPAPPTPTPASTPTINPTLAAAFIAPSTPTRLPTFTEPAPLSLETFEEDAAGTGGVPMGLLIFGFGFIGALGALISFLRGR